VRSAVGANRRKACDPSLTEAPLGLRAVHGLEDRSGGPRVLA
jgi:hypothetical protein